MLEWWGSIRAATASRWQHLAVEVARHRRPLLIACGVLALGLIIFAVVCVGWLPVVLEMAWAALPIALPICLLLVLCVWLTRHFLRIRKDIWPAIRRHWISILTIIGIFAFFLIDLPYLIQNRPELTSPSGKYWLQTVAGNWSPPQDAPPPDAQKPAEQNSPPAGLASPVGPSSSGPIDNPYWYAFSVILAILLNNALYLAIIAIMWTIARRNTVGNLDILLLNQSYVQTALEDLLQENKFSEDDQTRIVGLLRKAFTIGAQDTVASVRQLGPDAKAVLVASQLEEAARRAATITPQ